MRRGRKACCERDRESTEGRRVVVLFYVVGNPNKCSSCVCVFVPMHVCVCELRVCICGGAAAITGRSPLPQHLLWKIA